MPAISPPHRMPSGRIVLRDARQQREKERAETPAEAMAIARVQRIKRGATDADWQDQRHECPLGWLRLWGQASPADGISEAQYQALYRYITDRERYRRVYGLPAEHPRALDMDAIRGQSLAEDMDPAKIRAIARTHHDATAIFSWAGPGSECRRVLQALARDECPPDSWRMWLSYVRAAANALIVHYRIPS